MALTVHAPIAAIVLPIIGWLVDRWGARRIMLPGLFLYALATASYALIQASPLLLTFMIFALTGLVGGVQSPIPYAAVIAQWFDHPRGLALVSARQVSASAWRSAAGRRGAHRRLRLAAGLCRIGVRRARGRVSTGCAVLT